MSRWSAVILENVMAGDLGLDGMEALDSAASVKTILDVNSSDNAFA